MTGKIGDVFTMPVSEEQVSIGQIASAPGKLLYVVLYEGTWRTENIPPMNQAVSGPIVFAALTQDAKLYHGHWRIIGNTADGLSDVAEPVFKVRVSAKNQYYVQSMDGTRSRRSQEGEDSMLPNKFSVSPKRLEDAMKAHLGLADWRADFDKLKYDSVKKWSEVRV